MFADVNFQTCSLCSLVSFLARLLLQKEAENYEEACGEEEAPVDDQVVPPAEDQEWDSWYGGGYGDWASATDPTKEEKVEAEQEEEKVEEQEAEKVEEQEGESTRGRNS